MEYFSAVNAYKSGEEMLSSIQTHLVQAPKHFYGALSERLSFCRNGVDEGNIECVLSKEVKSLEAKLREIYTKVG